MRFMKKSKNLEYVEFNSHVWGILSNWDKAWIEKWCEGKLGEYFGRKGLK